jgi:hypothetical protein
VEECAPGVPWIGSTKTRDLVGWDVALEGDFLDVGKAGEGAIGVLQTEGHL